MVSACQTTFSRGFRTILSFGVRSETLMARPELVQELLIHGAKRVQDHRQGALDGSRGLASPGGSSKRLWAHLMQLQHSLAQVSIQDV